MYAGLGDFNVERTKIPCLAKGISAGLWVDLEASWASATGMQPAATCKHTWEYAGGHRGDFMVGCPLAAAAVLSCKAQPKRWVAPHLAVRTHVDCVWWTCRVNQPVQRTSLWPASWFHAVVESRGSKSVEVQKESLGVYDDRLQFMTGHDALLLDESVRVGDVSRAWLVWSGAAESALDDAYRFAGFLILTRGLVLGRGCALFMVVRLGEHKVRKARSNIADAHDAADVFMYRDYSIAPLLHMRRRFKAVLDVLDSMISHGVTLSRSVELTAQWGKILSIGPLHPVTLDDFEAVPGTCHGDFHNVVSGSATSSME